MSISNTLTQRGNRYGSFKDNAEITQRLMEVIESAHNYDQLSRAHKEAFHMIFHKISRAVCGEPKYIDNIHDIVGYAALLEEYLHELESSDADM